MIVIRTDFCGGATPPFRNAATSGIVLRSYMQRLLSCCVPPHMLFSAHFGNMACRRPTSGGRVDIRPAITKHPQLEIKEADEGPSDRAPY